VYGEFYGFQTPPFHVTPDAGFLYLTKPHREAVGVVEYGLRQRKGFIVITGEVGVGKTTVLRYCLRRLDPSQTVIVYILQPALTPHQLLALLWQELAETDAEAQAPWTRDTGELIRHLLFRLKSLHDRGKLIVIVIDEAQNMPVETLESLRLLSNLESDRQKFLQIVLAGQPELDDKLARRELRQLNQRIAVRSRLPNLTPAESLTYIQYRMERAAGRRVDIFTRPALDYIIAKSGGNPRRINVFCDNALINGLGHRARLIGPKIVKEAIAPHLIGDAPEGHAFSALANLASVAKRERGRAAIAALVVVGAAIWFGPGIWSNGATTASVAGWSATGHVAGAPSPQPGTQVALADDGLAADDAAFNAAYSVRSKETLAQLCQKVYAVCGGRMVRALLRANPGIDPKALRRGETIRLPVIENLKPDVR
jgi:type II secretory pathway predicted ATPase ExeA/phage tail protein X